MKNVQQGFTLIELMIVVAIIGILAAIAIPQYQDYIARTQVTRVYNEISDMKTGVETDLMKGNFPNTYSAVGFTSSDLMSAYPTVVFTSNNHGKGYMGAQLGGSASANVSGAKVELDRNTSGVWSCIVDKSSATAFKTDYIPSGCAAGSASF